MQTMFIRSEKMGSRYRIDVEMSERFKDEGKYLSTFLLENKYKPIPVSDDPSSVLLRKVQRKLLVVVCVFDG